VREVRSGRGEERREEEEMSRSLSRLLIPSVVTELDIFSTGPPT
jgi:hypothetical protein